MKNRTRNIKLEFYITEKESNLISEKMKMVGIENKSSYLRKMAIDGYVINQDFTLLRKLGAELNKIGSNVNQIAKVANTYGANELFNNDLKDIRKELEQIWQQLVLRV